MALTSRELSYRPDQPFRQTLRWRTAISKSRNGKETRRALREDPLEIYQAQYVIDDSEARRLRADFYNDLGQTFELPLWYDSYRTTGEATSGGTTVAGNFTDHDLIDGQLIFIVVDDLYDYGEFHTLSGISGSTLTITGSTWGETWPAGSRIYPARTVLMEDLRTIRREPVNLSRVELNLRANEFFSLGGSSATLQTHQSKNVLEYRPLAQNQPTEQFDGQLVVIDFDMIPEVVQGPDVSDLIMARQYHVDRTDRANWQWWLKFLDSTRGSQKTFFAPTWTADLVLDAQPGASATTIVIDISEVDFDVEWFSAGNSHKDLQIETDTDGAVWRRISSVNDNGDGTMDLDLSSALPSTSGLQVEKLSFLELCRLNSDEVTINHFSSHSIVNLQLRVVEQ